MSAVYFHIPFCKQACHYCNFHFSTSTHYRDKMLAAMEKEIQLRHGELPQGPLNSIYFGGGTPSLLSPKEIDRLLHATRQYFTWSPQIEISLEMNPDDNQPGYLSALKKAGINRLSIGVQSFFDEELTTMHRAHSAQEAYLLLDEVKKTFVNYSLDLIYGMPQSDLQRWQSNIDIALSFSPPHISSYALTVEPNTALAKFVNNGQVTLIDESLVAEQFALLVEQLEANGYDHYEISNFGKPQFYSVNNTAYWQGKPYLGIGPSAHSYTHPVRSWNVANNQKYMKLLQGDTLPLEREKLSQVDQYNEYIMTGLRTQWGVDSREIEKRFGPKFVDLFERQLEEHLKRRNLFWDGYAVKVSRQARFLVDGIASDLFLLHL